MNQSLRDFAARFNYRELIMVHIDGTKEQMVAFMKSDIEGPIQMLNLLRFKADGGRESYAEYSKHTVPMVEKRGGKVVYRAEGKATVIGGEEWDSVFIVEYPTHAAFVDMVTSEEYQATAHLRHEALEDSRLVCMQAT